MFKSCLSELEAGHGQQERCSGLQVGTAEIISPIAYICMVYATIPSLNFRAWLSPISISLCRRMQTCGQYSADSRCPRSFCYRYGRRLQLKCAGCRSLAARSACVNHDICGEVERVELEREATSQSQMRRNPSRGSRRQPTHVIARSHIGRFDPERTYRLGVEAKNEILKRIPGDLQRLMV